MKSNDEIFKGIQQSLESLKGNFQILETDVSVEKQMEYFNYSENVKKTMKQEDVESQIIILNDINSDLEQKKYSMALLAVSGDIKAYRALENYFSQHKEKENDWIKLSLLQARITLESEFSDQAQVFISTGLGGKGHKLRFFALFKAVELDIPFSSYQKDLIEKEIPFYLSKYEGEVEELSINTNYFSLVFLIDIKINIKHLLENILNECNQYGNFISQGFVITNIKKYSEEEIFKEVYKTDE